MKYRGSVGIGGVLSELGLGARWPTVEELITRLERRFEVSREEALEAIEDAEREGLVERWTEIRIRALRG